MSSRTVPIELMLATVSFAQLNGLDTDEMLRAAGMSPRLLIEGRSRVTEDQVTRFFQELWRHTDDEMLGLGSHPMPRGSFRLLCYGLIGARDLGELLDRFQGLVRAVPAFPAITVEIDGDEARVTVEQHMRQELDHTVADDLVRSLVVCTALAGVHRMLAWAIGGRLPLTAVDLPYPPRHEEIHAQVFGAPLVFGAAAPTLVFEASRLQTPVMRTEPELDEFIARSPAGLLTRPAPDSTVVEQVRRMVEHALQKRGPSQMPSGDDVAARLAISPQTLRRRLAAEGTSLRGVREEVLRDEAITALVQGEEPIGVLALRLGFSETSTFTRAFGRWTGNPPSVYRTGNAPDL